MGARRSSTEVHRPYVPGHVALLAATVLVTGRPESYHRAGRRQNGHSAEQVSMDITQSGFRLGQGLRSTCGSCGSSALSLAWAEASSASGRGMGVELCRALPLALVMSYQRLERTDRSKRHTRRRDRSRPRDSGTRRSMERFVDRGAAGKTPALSRTVPDGSCTGPQPLRPRRRLWLHGRRFRSRAVPSHTTSCC